MDEWDVQLLHLVGADPGVTGITIRVIWHYLKEQRDYLTGLLRLLISKVGEDGVEKLDGGGRFLDWPSSENPVAIDAGLQALMLQAMKAGGELCKVLGEDALAAECDAVRNRMTKAASKVIKPFLKSGVAPDAAWGSKQAASLVGISRTDEAGRG